MSIARQLLSINTATVQAMTIQERRIMTGIGGRSSTPAASAHLPFGPLGPGRRQQSDLTVHGGLSKAVYAYP